jgi:hypothetical protein
MQEDLKATPAKKPKVSVLKVAIGSLLFLLELKVLLVPDPNLPDSLKPSNETQALASFATSFVIGLVGLGLILWGLSPIWLGNSE